MKNSIRKLISMMIALMLVVGLGSFSAAAEEKITLSLWDVWPSGDMYRNIETFIAQYEQDHPNIHIERVSADSATYKLRKLPNAVFADEQGDVFFTWGAGYAKSFVDKGAVLCLDDYFAQSNVMDDLIPGSLSSYIYDGKLYGVPLCKWTLVLYCNTELFEQYNVDYPTTFQELLDACDKFAAEGITPIAAGCKQGIMLQWVQNAYAAKLAGADYVTEACRGEHTLNTPEIVESARVLSDLVAHKAFPEGVVGIDDGDGLAEFSAGMAAMIFNGSWGALEYSSPDSDVYGKVKIMPIPSIKEGDYINSSGGAVDCYMVSSKTKYPQEAFDLAIALAKYQSREDYYLGNSLPVWNVEFDMDKVNPLLAQIKEMSDPIEHYLLAWDTALSGSAIEAAYSLTRDLVGGTITPEEFAEKVQEANEVALSGF